MKIMHKEEISWPEGKGGQSEQWTSRSGWDMNNEVKTTNPVHKNPD